MTVNILTSRNLWQIAPPRTVLVIQFPGVLSRAAAYVKRLQGRVGEQEKALGEFELYVAEHHTSQEFLNDLKREITDSLRDLGRRIDHVADKGSPRLAVPLAWKSPQWLGPATATAHPRRHHRSKSAAPATLSML